MIAFIVPMFSNIFKRFGNDLPVITKAFINISDILKENILIILVSILLSILLLLIFWEKPSFRNRRQSLVCKIPFIGNLTVNIYLARFCSSMSLLISAKVPLVHAIGLVRKMISFQPLQIHLDQVEKDLINGMQFHKSLSQFKIFDPKMIALLKVGEEVNKIDLFFQKLHEYYSEEVDMKTYPHYQVGHR